MGSFVNRVKDEMTTERMMKFDLFSLFDFKVSQNKEKINGTNWTAFRILDIMGNSIQCY